MPLPPGGGERLWRELAVLTFLGLRFQSENHLDAFFIAGMLQSAVDLAPVWLT